MTKTTHLSRKKTKQKKPQLISCTMFFCLIRKCKVWRVRCVRQAVNLSRSYIASKNFIGETLRPHCWVRLLISNQKKTILHSRKLFHPDAELECEMTMCSRGNRAGLVGKSVVFKSCYVGHSDKSLSLGLRPCVCLCACGGRKRGIKQRALLLCVYCCATWRKHSGYLWLRS